jgi:4'-phosphopantetheinyl transferase
MLGRNEVHVWRASLDEFSPQRDNFLHTLAAEEQTRAERFYFQTDCGRFINAHGILRAILGLYLNRAPNCLSFCYSSYGKPALTRESGGDAIRFNMSHSRGVALYAVTRGREIGIDLEFIRSDLEVEQIAERFFSRSEIATLRALPTDLQKYAFFLCWTRKEAYIKARGEGLSLPLDQFDVSLIPGEPAELLLSKDAVGLCPAGNGRDHFEVPRERQNIFYVIFPSGSASRPLQWPAAARPAMVSSPCRAPKLTASRAPLLSPTVFAPRGHWCTI